MTLASIDATLAESPIFMYFVVGKPKGISSLNGFEVKPIGQLRSSVPILVIDDEGFPYQELLREHNFNIKLVKDISDFKAAESYPIVVCDIKGVGNMFQSRYEGAHVLAEIRKLYPTKYLIAYTGQRFDASYNEYFELCDRVLKKDADLKHGSKHWIKRSMHIQTQ